MPLARDEACQGWSATFTDNSFTTLLTGVNGVPIPQHLNLGISNESDNGWSFKLTEILQVGPSPDPPPMSIPPSPLEAEVIAAAAELATDVAMSMDVDFLSLKLRKVEGMV